MLIFKIVHTTEWTEVGRTGAYHGSSKDRADGFLHFSTASQLAETLRRYYADATDLTLVAVDAAMLGAALRFEHAPSRGEDFPHLFGALPLSAVKWTQGIERNDLGTHIIPDLVFARS